MPRGSPFDLGMMIVLSGLEPGFEGGRAAVLALPGCVGLAAPAGDGELFRLKALRAEVRQSVDYDHGSFPSGPVDYVFGQIPVFELDAGELPAQLFRDHHCHRGGPVPAAGATDTDRDQAPAGALKVCPSERASAGDD